MFVTRLISGIVLIIIALVTIISGNNVLLTTTLILSLIGVFELYRIADVQKKALGIAGYLAVIGYYLLLYFDLKDYIIMLALGFLGIIMAIYVLTFPKYNSEQVMTTFFGFFYVAVMLSYVYQVRMLLNGSILVWLIFLCSWGCDTCAYCVGMLFGKHKMAPKLSPKKSVEGAIGGILGATLLGAVYFAAMDHFFGIKGSSIMHFAIICGVGAIISQIGDLAASAIKRNHDIKDYGKLIPGHGGVLDRFDSVIFTAPCIYFLATMLLK